MKISIIGGGNMGGAIARGLACSTKVKAENITVINRSKIGSYGERVKCVLSDYSSLNTADIIILAVKPWYIEKLIEEQINSLNNRSFILASVAAGVSLDKLKTWYKGEGSIFRLMPNTAIAVKESITLVATEDGTEEEQSLLLEMFNELGKVEIIDESIFTAATALGSAGIAFAFKYISASIEGAIEIGINPQMAQRIVAQTLKGTVSILENSDTFPQKEIYKVTTPGGITIKGLNAMEHAGFNSAVIRALKASNVDS